MPFESADSPLQSPHLGQQWPRCCFKAPDLLRNRGIAEIAETAELRWGMKSAPERGATVTYTYAYTDALAMRAGFARRLTSELPFVTDKGQLELVIFKHPYAAPEGR